MEDIRNQVRQDNRDIVALAPALLSPIVNATFSPQSPVRVSARKYNGALYIIAVNTSTSPATASFTVPALAGRKLRVFADGRTVTPMGNLVVDKLPALGVAVYIALARRLVASNRSSRRAADARARSYLRLHGNAALSWHGRRRLAERVVVEGWTLTAAAEAACISLRCARKWAGRYRLAGRARPARPLLSTPSCRQSHSTWSESRRSPSCAGLRFTAAEIAETLQMALSTVSVDPHTLGRSVRLGRLGLEPAVRYERSSPGRAPAHRRQEARPDRGRCRQTRLRKRAPPAAQPHPHRSRAQASRLAMRPADRRSWPTRAAAGASRSHPLPSRAGR